MDLTSSISTALARHSPLLAVTSFPQPSSPLFALVIIAILIGAAVVAIWYIIGVLLNNSTVKATARGEAYQLAGTSILVGIVIFVLFVFSGVYLQMLGGNPLIGSAAISSECNGLYNGALLNVIQQAVGGPTYICNPNPGGQGITNQPYASITNEFDYPLAAVAVITASIANQTTYNFNSLFIFDAWLQFLQNFRPTFGVCVQTPSPGPTGPCMFPIIPYWPVPPVFYFKWTTQPYAGLELISKSVGTFGTILMTSLASFVVQLEFQNIMLNVWPYLFFFGIIFRATIFTRRLGGLLIAVAIGAVIIYPTIFAVQYLTVNYIMLHDPQQITFCPGGVNGPYQYNESFYYEPDVASIAYHCGCYPNGGSLSGQEFLTIAAFNVPFLSAFSFFDSLITSWIGNGGSFPSGSVTGNTGPGFSGLSGLSGLLTSCSATSAEDAMLNIVYGYGLVAIAAFFLPIINLLITISAIRGLSGLLGGDTDLAGLSKFI